MSRLLTETKLSYYRNRIWRHVRYTRIYLWLWGSPICSRCYRNARASSTTPKGADPLESLSARSPISVARRWTSHRSERASSSDHRCERSLTSSRVVNGMRKRNFSPACPTTGGRSSATAFELIFAPFVVVDSSARRRKHSANRSLSSQRYRIFIRVSYRSRVDGRVRRDEQIGNTRESQAAHAISVLISTVSI